MSTKTTPGFTAETSLYQTDLQYRSTGMPQTVGMAGVWPQQMDFATLLGQVVDPCAYCRTRPPNERARCYCVCDGGWWIGGHCA